MKKVITVFLIILIMFSFCNINKVYAKSIWELGKEWIKLGEKEKTEEWGDPDYAGFNDIAGVVWALGVSVSLIAGVTLGIKYMFASVEAKAEIKKSIIPWLIGTIIVLGALTIWKFGIGLFENIGS